ncbi:hypothetical protein ULMS_25800 [Patiriisocius marinistellae]|uniref:Lipocalin-like domain-containing protein n=2 Tax=Patiriisocius marinistellae TaxID=2494560 RepID=A0A5J4G0H4_9FLAO|nr:hypothetical protein ULMS_25800 [Patiriisocius marinistellae]
MKNNKILKTVIVLFIGISILSCKNDDDNSIENDTTSNLIGEWQRSDSDDQYDYKLIFNTDNTGIRTLLETNADGQVISNASTYTWSTSETLLNFEFDDESLTTPFSINSNGQLLLSGLSNLLFNKLQ